MDTVARDVKPCARQMPLNMLGIQEKKLRRFVTVTVDAVLVPAVDVADKLT